MSERKTWIVTINGWLLIAASVLAVFQKAKVHATDQKIVALLTLVLSVTVGAGLLLRRNWGRWMALGMSLIAWTVGSVALFLGLVYGVKEMMRSNIDIFGRVRSSADTFLLFMIMLVFFSILAVVIWLNFRLFEHLNSEAGREEFDSPTTETRPVLKSTAVYLVWCAVAAIIVEPGLVGAGHSSRDDFAEQLEQLRRFEAERAKTSPTVRENPGVSLREARQLADENAALAAQRDAAQAAAREEQAAAEMLRRQLAQNESRERARVASETRANAQQEYHRKIRELFERRVRDRSYTDAQFEADSERLKLEFARANDAARSGEYQGATRMPATASERPSSAILKCRDASGAISFTQGYCPAGTALVESPPAE